MPTLNPRTILHCALLAPTLQAWTNDRCAAEVKWEQPPIGSVAMLSQDDACYPFRATTADNFTGTGGAMQSIRWWGSYRTLRAAGNAASMAPDRFTVRIWASVDYGSYVCPDGYDGYGWLWETSISEYSESPFDGAGAGAAYEFFGVLDTPFETEAEVEYFVSVSAEMCYPPLWEWANGEGDGRQCCFVADPTYALDQWLPASVIWGAPYETAMVLYSDDPVPVADVSWSRLKALYR
jgi:hypothetical protein